MGEGVRANFDWMRVVLRTLYAEWTPEHAVSAIRSPEQLAALRDELTANGVAGIPVGDYGDNLLLALLSLRAKFPEPEGFAKLETNIAMRERRPGAHPA